MDQTIRPLLIPPQFALYAEKHAIFDLYQRMLGSLLIHKPDDPLQYLIDFLKKDVNSSATIILGPPDSGKKVISRLLAKKTGAVLLTKDNLLDSVPNNLKPELGANLQKRALDSNQWAKVIKTRIDEYDCVRKGWILENFPETRHQCLALLATGIIPKHTIILNAPDSVLIERAAGKRVDSKTGEIYHTTFDYPTEPTVQSRLVVPEKYTEEDLVNRFVEYHRHIGGLEDCLKASLKVINVDQPKGDVFNQILDYVGRPARSHTPISPRVILIGPYGSGRRTQASGLAKKYEIVDISVSALVKEAITKESTLGLAIKPHFLRKAAIPETLLLPLLTERLSQLDCVTKGWVLHGYPRNRSQAESLDRAGFSPNRVFFLDIPNDSIMERITLRHIDPVSGDGYHMLFNPPPTQDVRDRLQQKPNDAEQIIRGKVQLYYAEVRHLIDYYDSIGLHINADQDPHTVFESIEAGIVHPLPKNHQDSASSTNK